MDAQFLKKLKLLIPQYLYKNILLVFSLNFLGTILEIFSISLIPIIVLNILNPSYLEEFSIKYGLTFFSEFIYHDYFNN